MNALLSPNSVRIFIGDGTSLTQVTTSDPRLEIAGNVSINDGGELAFLAVEPNGVTNPDGIYAGSASVQNRVIEVGDPLGGSTVTELAMGTDALNDSGQIAFWAQLANGSSGVYVASSAPEPATLSFLAFAVLPLMLRRQRA